MRILVLTILLSTSLMVFAGTAGIAKYHNGIWTNILPGVATGLASPADDVAHDYSNADANSGFLSDTLYFRGASTWSLVERTDGSLLPGGRRDPDRGRSADLLHHRSLSRLSSHPDQTEPG